MFVIKHSDGTYAKGRWCSTDNLQEARVFKRRCDASNSDAGRRYEDSKTIPITLTETS